MRWRAARFSASGKKTRKKPSDRAHRSSTNQRSPWPSNRTAGRRVSSRGAFNSSILESRREDLPLPRPPRSPPGRRGGRGCVVEISGYRVGRGGGRPFTHAPERGATLKQLRNHGFRLHVHRGRAPRRPGARSARPRPRSATPPAARAAIRHRSGGIGTLSAPSEIALDRPRARPRRPAAPRAPLRRSLSRRPAPLRTPPSGPAASSPAPPSAPPRARLASSRRWPSTRPP